MAFTSPQILGTQIVFEPEWTSQTIVLPAHQVLNYMKNLYPNAQPKYEVGPLGQVSQRQLNSVTPPYFFTWDLLLSNEQKEDFEAMVSIQNHRYAQNLNRSQVEILYSDEYWATVELLEFARPVRSPELRFDTAPTLFCHWQYSQFTIKFDNFDFFRYNKDFWRVVASATESKINREDLTAAP